MKRNLFKQNDNKQLTEILRIILFLSNSVDEKLLLLSTPSKVKSLVELGYVKCSYKYELIRVNNWYRLTDKGIKLFNSIKNKKDELNKSVFENKLDNQLMFCKKQVIDFNKFV